MAKLVITYENGVEKKELHFKNEVFSYSMIPNGYGESSDKPGFDKQLTDKFGDDNEDFLEAADQLDFTKDEDEIREALEVLSLYE